jgi:nucleoside-diphosphate-sugar epimerase
MLESQPTTVFFYSYLQPKPPADAPKGHAWGNAEELVKVNKTLFGNFLEALQKANVRPKRIMLQTGAKNYGVHIGRHRTPACESDPPPKHLEPNFYYPQYELLHEYCRSNNVGWNVIMPAWIIGSVTTAQINCFHPLVVYAAVQAHKGEPLHFPSTWSVWQDERKHATARLTGYLTEWAVLEDKCKDQMFNT